MRAQLALLLGVCLLLHGPVRGESLDADGDGLSDFQEIHKYRTDPKQASTAGDGVSDGDWERRREFTYTVRSVIKVMEPVRIDCLNDDFQDARVLSRGDGYVELEVVHYPLNTVGEAITGSRQWRSESQAQKEFLRPGITTNWDESMRRDLLTALKADRIDPEQLDDCELVSRVAGWLLRRSTFTNMFCTHYVYFPNGRAAIYPGLEARFAVDKGNPAWTTDEQFEHELFGRTMFAHRSHGTCTSTAVYLTTVLRALGIPTRMVLVLPVVDATDAEQVAMVRNKLRHHGVRRAVLQGLAGAGGYANHTFNEVFVGQRWVRLNYSKLGQNILDPQAMGLMTHVNTFSDLSEASLAATWGKRYALGERDEVFRHGNPYRTVELSDHFGKYARVENPATPEHRTLTLTRAYWIDAPESPAFIKRFAANLQSGEGHVVIHADEWFGDQSYVQYRTFIEAAPKEFVFRAEGHADIKGKAQGSFTDSPEVHEIDIVIPARNLAAMAADVDYAVVPPPRKNGYGWATKGRLVIRKVR